MSASFFTASRRFVSAASVAAVLVLAACSKGPDAGANGTDSEEELPTVGVMTVHLGEVGLATELPGRLEAAQSADVRARASGVVLKRLFTEGAWVKQGQALYQLDDATYGDAVASARADLAKAQAQYELAVAKRRRYQPMAEKMVVSKQDYDVVVADEKSALASLQAAKAGLAQAQTNQARTIISAPISGRIGRALVSEGDLLNAGDATVVAQIRQSERLYINFTQDAGEVLQLRRALAEGGVAGGSAESAPVRVVLDDGTLYPTLGRLLFTDMTVDPDTGKVHLRAEVPNPDGLLLPGLFVKVRIEQGSVPHAVKVPHQAVTRGSGADTVQVVDAEGHFAPRMVEIAKGMGQDWVVTGGLNEGEQVMVSGQMKLMPGVTQVQTAPHELLQQQESENLANMKAENAAKKKAQAEAEAASAETPAGA